MEEVLIPFFHRKKILIENFLSLSLLKGLDYLLPLITVPYLVRVLGPEKFGLVIFAQAFAQYFAMFTDYGFDLSATKEISVNRGNISKVSEIFSTVVSTKILLISIAFFTYMTIVCIFGVFSQYFMLYVISFGAVLGQCLLTRWLFQGMERMKFITLLVVIARMFFVVMTFIYVKGPDNYLLVNLFYSSGMILAGVVGIVVVFAKFDIKFKFSRGTEIIAALKNGYYIFIALMANTLYTTSNIFILGLMTNNTIVGYYGAAEKISKAAQSLFNPVSQTIYPHISNLIQISKDKALVFIRKILIISVAATFVVSLLLLVYAPQIVMLVLGDDYLPSIIVLRIMSFLPFIGCIGNVLGTQLMLNYGMEKIFAKIIVIAGLFNICLAFVLILLYGQNGLASSVIVTEALITLLMFVFLEINKISPRMKWIKQ
ncbi:MAG: flippase [Candidatus Margulisiibacteriota bacterium]